MSDNTMPGEVERVARALCLRCASDLTGKKLAAYVDVEWMDWADDARAAIVAYKQQDKPA